MGGNRRIERDTEAFLSLGPVNVLFFSSVMGRIHLKVIDLSISFEMFKGLHKQSVLLRASN